MGEIVTIGLDIAKSVFQVHAVNAAGEPLVRRQLKRGQVLKFFGSFVPALVGIEACGTAHFWARELIKLGHDVRLMPPAYVKPYVKRQKNDAADAEAICEAVTRPHMRLVPIKSEPQQAACMLHRTRALLVKQKTMLLNAVRAQMGELGIPTGAGVAQSMRLVRSILDGDQQQLDAAARSAIEPLARMAIDVQERITKLDKEITSWHDRSDMSTLLETIPGVGVIS